MMFFVIVFILFYSYISAENYQESSVFAQGRDTNQHGISDYKLHKNSPYAYNTTYFDKSENLLRVPVLNKDYKEHKKRRTFKKTPKRTIQKIIKKNKKYKKLYFNMVPSQPTQSSVNIDMDAQEDLSRNFDMSTTQMSQKKKSKNRNSKLPRYPMPFQKMQSRREQYRRNKRKVDRDDVFILKDFDEMEFLNKGKDYNVVNAHMKKYW